MGEIPSGTTCEGFQPRDQKNRNMAVAKSLDKALFSYTDKHGHHCFLRKRRKRIRVFRVQRVRNLGFVTAMRIGKLPLDFWVKGAMIVCD